MRRLSPIVLVAAAACGGEGSVPGRGVELPVVLNRESPFQYPAHLFDAGVEGEVRLRLFVDASGRIVPESTRVASTSGTPELDSAALSASVLLRFAPARDGGQPVPMAFYQPVVFRRLLAPRT